MCCSRTARRHLRSSSVLQAEEAAAVESAETRPRKLEAAADARRGGDMTVEMTLPTLVLRLPILWLREPDAEATLVEADTLRPGVRVPFLRGRACRPQLLFAAPLTRSFVA